MIIRQVKKSYQNLKFSWKFPVKLLGFFLFLYFLSWTFDNLTSARYFPIKEVKISGAQHTPQQDIQNTLLPLVNKNFFLVKVDLIRERLLQFSWISKVAVRRIWPNEISIKITEKKPLARWNNAALLSTAGDIFTPGKSADSSQLPHFIGPEGEQMKILTTYNVINRLFKKIHLEITRLELTQSQAWVILLNNGIKLNSSDKDILTRMEHFVKVYPKIVANRVNEVDSIDLRYTNGVAVKWKTMKRIV